MTPEPKDMRLPLMATRLEADAIGVWRYESDGPGLGLQAADRDIDAASKMKNPQEK